MADPIIKSSGPATITNAPSSPASPAPTTTGGFEDDTWKQALSAAYEQAGKGATTFTPASAQPETDADGEPENILTPPEPEKPKEEPKPEKPVETPKERPKTKSEQWKELHRLREQAEKERDEFKTKYELAIKDAQKRHDPEEVKRLKEERDDYEQRLKAFAVEHDPAFESQMNQRTSRIMQNADSVLGEHAERFKSLMNLPESEFKRQQISSLLGEMDEYTKYSAIQIANQYRDLQVEKGEYVKNARENYQKILDAQARQAESMRTRVMSEFDDTVKQWQDPQRGIPALQIKDGDEAWNNKVRETVDLARNILTGQLPPQDLIKASLWSASAPRLLESMSALQRQNAELQQQLNALKAATPDATRSGGSESQSTDAEDDFKGLSYGQILALKAERAGGFAR